MNIIFKFICEETEPMTDKEASKEIKAIAPDILDFLNKNVQGFRWGAFEVKEIKIIKRNFKRL